MIVSDKAEVMLLGVKALFHIGWWLCSLLEEGGLSKIIFSYSNRKLGWHAAKKIKACLSETGNPCYFSMPSSRQERNQTELQSGFWWARCNVLMIKLLLCWHCGVKMMEWPHQWRRDELCTSSVWTSLRPLTQNPTTSFPLNWRDMDWMDELYGGWGICCMVAPRQWWSRADLVIEMSLGVLHWDQNS